MVQVSYPGVYVQERASGVRTITGVSTSIAAFFGRATKGPLDRAVRCLSLSDFVRAFGVPHPQSDLAASVTQFFSNGGTDCYIVRLAGAGADRARVDIENFAGVAVMQVGAKSAGLWGNGIRVEVDYRGSTPGETFGMTVIQEEGGQQILTERFEGLSLNGASPRYAPEFVSQSSQLVDVALVPPFDPNAGSFPAFSEARRPLGPADADVNTTFDDLVNPGGGATRSHSFDISVDGSPFQTVNLGTWTAVPATAANIASELQTRVNAALATLVPARQVTISMALQGAPLNQHFLRITAATPGGDNGSVRVRRAAANDIAAALLLGAENGGSELGRRSDFRPATNGTALRYEDGAGGLTELNEMAAIPQNGITGVTIGTEPPVPLALHTTTGPDTDPFYLDGRPGASPSGHHDGVREKLQIIAQAISNAPGSRYRAEVQGYQLVILARDGTLNEQPTVVFAGGSAAVLNGNRVPNTRQYGLGVAGTSAFSSGADGHDGGAPGFAEYVGDPVTKSGFYALDRVDLFNLMALPTDHLIPDPVRRQLWGPASIYCRSRRAFLIVNPPDAWTDAQSQPAVVQNTSQIDELRATVVKDHSAVYYPKVRINDRGVARTIGPDGTIAGLMARTDASRGVWKAPAGTEADLRLLVGLDVKLTDMENGVLNKLGVNCLRSFVAGHVSWGARTLDGADDLGSEWKYVPIRRLALFMEESLYRGTQWVVFEPNDEPLWANIRLNVGVFMNQLFRQGAFQGSTPDQAYFVKCDGETTTQADRNLGIVNIEVGFAPLKPAEFVIITIQQIAGDLL